MSDADTPAVGGDDLMSPHELLEELDTDGSGWIESDEFEKRNSIDKELDKIRVRRSGESRSFPRAIEDFVLIGGLIYGILFFGGTLAMSAGILGDSVVMDENLSDTFLDFENCTDPGDEVWINAWIDDAHNIRIDAMNVPLEAEHTTIGYNIGQGMNASLDNSTTIKIDFTEWPDETYQLDVTFTNDTFEIVEEVDGEGNLTGNTSEVWSATSLAELQVTVEIKSRPPSMGWLPWVDDAPTKEAEITTEETRRCWTTSELGNWGWIMMGAEWGGGRETAMLAGGSAGVPPWWMAFISMSMSVFFLFVQYPLMYRFYHTEDDDMLNESQLKRLIQQAIQKVEKKMRLEVDWDTWKMQERDISIDVLVPYRTTMETHVDIQEIRGAMVTLVLDEFKKFGVMKPLHLQAKAVDSSQGIFETLEHGLDVKVEAQGERAELVDDYSKFFETVGMLAGVEDRTILEVKKWFKTQRLIDRGSKVYSDDVALYIRIIYKPNLRFAFFRFKRSYAEVEADIENHIRREMGEYLEDRRLVVSARNEVQTLSDRAAAGRVEMGGEEGKHQALVAKQEGIVGTLLQNQVMGDVLSTVEFVAQEKRDFINRWGFWGLIVFVWIPFMASGVLVGAMLGLLSRMRFTNVLIACSIGGFAASVTWAYTARGIIEVMERYHAEALIPWLIAVVILFAVFHLRTSKKRRREALFKETIQFFGGTPEKEA
ncbi:MAG: small multi-drug export protein [Candidatus Thalassarchaeaceae archaeon]|nr:small multi-drug export protein [Candidatus Thalassarchaeaceae archaeon]